VEGLADLLNAETEAQRRLALRQADVRKAAKGHNLWLCDTSEDFHQRRDNLGSDVSSLSSSRKFTK